MDNPGRRNMRILFLTNFYMNQGAGGEEQSCQQVVEGLMERGHTTLVLTSMHGTKNVPVEVEGTYRSLYLEVDLVPLRHSITFFTERKAREKHNLQCFERVLEQFEPDIIFIWGMWNLPRSLPVLAEARYPDKVVYRFATYWPTLPSAHDFYWRAPGRTWYSWIPKRLLGRIALTMLANETRQYPLTFKHAICVSAAARNILVEAGVPVSNARVIYTGLDINKYVNGEQSQHGYEEGSLNLLYAGRLASDKGIETAVEAMKKLVHGQGKQNIRLSLAGSGSDDYENHLRYLVNQAGLSEHVSFLGWVTPEEMPGLLHKFDVLLVPSIWAEPFARVVMEGMVSGLVVVATPTGGTTEILIPGENGLLFAAGDAEDLAEKIICLDADPKLRRRLALAGEQIVVERFTKTKMMDEIESYLQEVFQSSTREKAGQLERK
jgi:glycosyltransferase involved in cell wall biosynthesis